MNLKRIAIVAVSTAVLAAGAGVAIGATSGDDAEQREQAVLADAARRLDTTPERLREALGAALDAQLDAAVADGDLTQEQADAIKERRQESGSVLGFGGGPGHHGRGGPGFGGFGGRAIAGVFDDLAEALGISEQRLANRLRAGRTVTQIAEAQGKSLADVRQAVRASVNERVDQAVADGDLTQAQADELLEHADEHIDRLGELGGERFGGLDRHRGGGPPPFGFGG